LGNDAFAEKGKHKKMRTRKKSKVQKEVNTKHRAQRNVLRFGSRLSEKNCSLSWLEKKRAWFTDRR